MKLVKAFALVVVLVPGIAFAQKKGKKPIVPAVFDHAQYIYVQAIDGDEFKPGLLTEDRLAIADVRDALRAWGRYTYTPERDKADLVFVVRKGRLASAHAGMGVGNPPEIGVGTGPGMGRQPRGQGAPGVATDLGGETGPEDDLLEVCQVNENGKLTSPLWIRSQQYGLNAPRVVLIAQLKDAVEKAYPKKPDQQPAKP